MLTKAKGMTQTGQDFYNPMLVAADAVIFHGGLVGKKSGFAVAAATDSDKCVGMADLNGWDDQAATGQPTQMVNTAGQLISNAGGANGDRKVRVRRGRFMVENDANDPVAATEIGDDVYITDDETIHKTDGGGDCVAGVLAGFDARYGKPLIDIGVGEAV